LKRLGLVGIPRKEEAGGQHSGGEVELRLAPCWKRWYANCSNVYARLKTNGWNLKMMDGFTTQKTNMTMENPSFEDVFPIQNGDVTMSFSFQGCMYRF